jgi:hypothetical protein
VFVSSTASIPVKNQGEGTPYRFQKDALWFKKPGPDSLIASREPENGRNLDDPATTRWQPKLMTLNQ